MTDNEFAKAIYLCEKLDFFGGQRAGRELWFEKPVDVQDRDIKQFVEDVAFLKDFINRQKAEIGRLQRRIVNWREDMDYHPEKVKAEAIKEFSDRLHRIAKAFCEYDEFGLNCATFAVEVDKIDNLVKEMTEEQQ